MNKLHGMIVEELIMEFEEGAFEDEDDETASYFREGILDNDFMGYEDEDNEELEMEEIENEYN